MNKKNKIAILVPAHNEFTVIGDNLKSLLKVAGIQNVYLVDDGSTDRTAKVVQEILPKSQVLVLEKNKGKAGALNYAIRKFRLCEKFEYIMPLDADTSINRDFITKITQTLDADKEKKIACVIGKVLGISGNWVTAYRIWEYEVTQSVHKAAQSILGTVAVCPGCSTVYRSKVFEELEYPQDTMTEDMDFTYLIHRKNLGKIVYQGDVGVRTQDPATLRDFVKQIRRWYTGFWQCVKKHNIPWGGQKLDFEVAMLATEGIYNSLIVVLFLLLWPYLLINKPLLLVMLFVFDFILMMLPTLLYVGWKSKSWNIFTYFPLFYLLRVISSLVFFEAFLRVVFGLDLNMGWLKARRYKKSERGKIWLSMSRE